MYRRQPPWKLAKDRLRDAAAAAMDETIGSAQGNELPVRSCGPTLQ
jgi:hypothetical protein